VGIPGHHPGLR